MISVMSLIDVYHSYPLIVNIILPLLIHDWFEFFVSCLVFWLFFFSASFFCLGRLSSRQLSPGDNDGEKLNFGFVLDELGSLFVSFEEFNFEELAMRFNELFY